MHYTNICAGDESVEDRFGMKVFSEKFLGVDGQPSHKRYVRYFANLLSGTTKVNPAPIFLTNISLKKINGKGIVLKIYERMKPVYSSQSISIKSNAEIEIENGLSLRGDVLVKCFEKRSGSERSLVFQCQFNTCALDLETQRPILHFYREELDLITSDRSLDNQAAIEFSFVFEPPKEKKFTKSSKRSLSLSSTFVGGGSGGGRGDQSTREGEFSRADSYENFDRPEGLFFFVKIN
uniref:C2 tensin-type domain-containing protein n=1 Tax=Panagrolaimus superbus TaxID=310955 RepID=A0A914Z326_9BILA